MSLSRIKYHKLREYWKNEATDFSEWLAKKQNLELLSKTIGIPLEFLKREASNNSRLRVDILARNKETGEVVIIENQLEKTDHSHLGKLVTYASIFESRTIIWIVRSIRPEHELAISWLNNNSKEPVNIFLIRIDLISIMDSKWAPLFTVISKPVNHNLPQLKMEFLDSTIKAIEKKEKIEKEVMDYRILDFFDKYIKLDTSYTKHKTSSKCKGILEMLLDFNSEVYQKYNIRMGRELKRDLLLWSELRDLELNQKHFERTGNRDLKTGGKEYFIISRKKR
ncbi:hypothetical protein R3X28_11655 [Maribacter sp. TH_r10]|uniref:hypothetical protein n=1 Tax=Maribacter sp. TH_r10 TaxID=3082086 RepID=UPI0029540405|nr:hypothetical protein [Maribacter sp. TH_r10]MDV7139538.1 hypothetical protein [Maribacter sp. TH_r10]